MYRMGLTVTEIKEYLKRRGKTKQLGHLYDKFCRIAGVNTQSIGRCEHCKKEFGLMYRYDVERFASVLIDKKSTYWD